MGDVIDLLAWRQRRANGLAMPRPSTALRPKPRPYVDVYYGFWDDFGEDLTPSDTPSGHEQP